MISSLPRNAYTDKPEQHPNFIRGALELIFWLFVCPAAWCNHITRIDQKLHADFCLAELNQVHWHKPALRRLLTQVYIFCPVLVGLIVGLVLVILERPVPIISTYIIGGMATAVSGSVIGGSGVSVAFGIAFGITFGITSGVTTGMVNPFTNIYVGLLRGIPIGLAIGLAGSVASTIDSQRQNYSLARLIFSVFVVFFTCIIFTMGFGFVIGILQAKVLALNDLFAYILMVYIALLLALFLHERIRFRQRLIHVFIFVLMIAIIFTSAYIMFLVLSSGFDLSNVFEKTLECSKNTRKCVFFPGITNSLGAGVLWSVYFIAPYALGKNISGPWAGAIAGIFVSNGMHLLYLWLNFIKPNPQIDENFSSLIILLCLVAGLLGFILIFWWPLVCYPFLIGFNRFLYFIDNRWGPTGVLHALRYHSAFWDGHQRLPLFGLDQHIVLVAERNLVEGQAAIQYLSTRHQSWAAQAAQIELDARELERCLDVEAIAHTHNTITVGELEGPASALLRSFSRVSEDVSAALEQKSTYNQRAALKDVGHKLDGLLRELTRSSDKYAARFYPIATCWYQIVICHIQDLETQAELHQEIDSPYIIGVPLTEQQRIFVGRTDISARIEQLLRDRRRPALLLYGQRRTGKTSVLYNLGRLLPNTIIPMFVDLQGPATAAKDHAGFLYNLARGMVDSAQRQGGLILPSLTRAQLAIDPFTGFDEWLDQVEQSLGQNIALLALDEFEALDKALADAKFSETDVLGMLRNLIQHRPQFKVMLSGSHTLLEFQRWSSYLINAQVVHLGYLNKEDALQLIERPVPDFSLRYQPDASEQVFNLTQGHPFLVQLLCAEIVALKNEQVPTIRRLATLADVEAAVPEALSHGSMFFSDIQVNQIDEKGLTLLRNLAAVGEGAVVSREQLCQHCSEGIDETLELLLRRELIEPVEGGYCFQAELIRRWFLPQHQNKI